MTRFRLTAVPAPLEWRLDPVEWAVEEGGGLSIRAGEKTDLFTDPKDGTKFDAAPAALFTPPEIPFTLSARVRVGFAATYDAGVLHVRLGDERWAKLCFEYSPQLRPTAVTVVTRETSDDCNSFEVAGNTLWLRVTRSGAAWAFHASADGAWWRLLRYFTLSGDAADLVRVGFLAQSPTGEGCAATFDQITFRPGAPENLRDGS